MRLARKYGVSDSTVLARLRAAGVEIRPRKDVERSLQTDEMRRLRDQGWTLRDIGEKFGVTRQAVAMRLNRTAP